MIEWPEASEPGSSNPLSIEIYLREVILESDVTLLGEIDFDVSRVYGGLDWSLRNLAAYAFGTQTLTKAIERWNFKTMWNYPSIIAVWSVSQAQRLDDGTELWATTELSNNGRSHLAKAFTQSIELLGLEKFEEQLVGAQAHMTLARIHALIPNYALPKYVNHVRRSAEFHLAPEVAVAEIIKAQDMSVPIQRLFAHNLDLAVDLVERSITSLRHKVDAGLPPRITQALFHDGAQSRFTARTKDNQVPQVVLDVNARELFLVGHTGWQVTDINLSQVNKENIPSVLVQANRAGGIPVVILNPFDEYLIFDADGYLISGRSVPQSGAWIAWSGNVKIDSSAAVTEALPLHETWDGWRVAYFADFDKIAMDLPNGKTRVLTSRQELQIEDFAVSWMYTVDRKPIFSRMPVLKTNQNVTVIDNLSGSKCQFTQEGSPLSNFESGRIDLTVYAGLGRSKQVQGIVIPEFQLVGDQSPLIKGEQRKLNLRLPPEWIGPTEIVTDYVQASAPQVIQVIDPVGEPFPVCISPTVMTWTVEFINQDPHELDTATKYQLSEIAKARRLVLHGLDLQTPRLLVVDSGIQTLVLEGDRRANECAYDLRPINDTSPNSQIDLKVNLNGRIVELAHFLPVAPSPARQRHQRIELADLARTVVEHGFFSQEEWNSYIAERNLNTEKLKKIRRERM